MTASSVTPEPIAIIGSGCRFPGEASSPSRLWDLLQAPRDCLTEIPKDRFNWEGYRYPDGPRHGSSTTKYTHFIKEDIRRFDPHFFNIQPAEADAIDPQQRLLLETVYEGIESAGLTIEGLQGSPTAVYVGMMGCDYADVIQGDVDCTPTYAGTGTSRSIHSNRISYFFDWHGPSMTIDTACSSSMMAIHLAMQSLRSGESKVALTAQDNYVVLSNLNMIAADGRAKMWDADANGYARGEGVAAVILKPLSAAIADGDHIECVIRETGINQDGRTRGITMPSSTAQADLIRQTYARAGLDLSRREDRPQYFEAHGTGTMGLTPEDDIYIGSIKTVIGHTEGAAGIAGVLKASLALQNAQVPPNLLFNRLSPAVAPFAKHLRLPTTLKPWPALPQGAPRRASVNSFGFGGSNGHAILESYEPPKASVTDGASALIATPFVFSAQSERTLVAMLERFADYLQGDSTPSLRDVAWTLHTKRSTFGVRSAITAANTDELISKVQAKLKAAGETPVGVKSTSKRGDRILGIFTGQGAQWATMGRELLRSSSTVRKIISTLDKSLAQLPPSDRPPCSIEQEMMNDDNGRIGQASVSQLLCTAVQIVLVDMLESAGVRFRAVVGHSSGEIGAAYAAKFITATDAIRIAYYRGLYAKLAGGKEGQSGAMMAAGTSLDDARELCALPEFEGRISVAAFNSSASVTLSGDKDTIEQAQLVFTEEKKFARVLRVDTAYHSHHMQRCAEPYVAALKACQIVPQTPPADAPVWFSSVRNGEQIVGSPADLAAQYWESNMTQPVLFATALEAALTHSGPFDLAIEVGPHPALQAPATQTMQDVSQGKTPYTGVLSRGKNDVTTFAEALGVAWTHCDRATVDFAAYDRRFFPDGSPVSFVKTLPAYPWDHERSYWYESRTEKSQRLRSGPVHNLLGVPYGDITDTEVKWRNFLIPNEIPWLKGHQLQGQAVFPAAAYAAMAWEAALLQVGEHQPVRVVEVTDLTIHRSISFPDDASSVETVLTLANITRREGDSFSAQFTVQTPPNKDSEKLVLVGSGSISLLLGAPTAGTMPPRAESLPNMVDIDPDDFYGSLSQLGYGYTGSFRAMTSLQRKMNHSTGTFEIPTDEKLLVHPALLDIAFQALFAALSYPGDGALWSLHVPTSIRRIRVNPFHCVSEDDMPLELSFDATLVETVTANETLGDVVILAPDGQQAMLQVEGVSSVPFTKATQADDRNIFSEMVWKRAEADGASVLADHRATPEEIERAYACERVAHFYLKQLHYQISAEEARSAAPHHQRLLDFAAHLVAEVAGGKRSYTETAWVKDTEEDIHKLFAQYPDDIDLRIMRSVGESYPSVVRGHSNPLEHLTKDNMLNDFYTDGLGFHVANTWAAGVIKQISHRYPHLNIMEIGAGTGGATRTVLDQLGSAFRSYTYTDISTAFFEKAQEKFADLSHKMVFKAFDMEKDVQSQGMEPHSFDLIFASNVIHATKRIEDVLPQVRALLKPGGYLVLLEITDQRPSRMGFIMGGLSGWWQGEEPSRRWAPTMRPAQWNSVLQKTGFSGLDTIVMPADTLPYPFSVGVAQALDDRVDFLRQPLYSQATDAEHMGELLIIGGQTLESSRLTNDISKVLGRRFASTTILESLAEVTPDTVIPPTVLVLVEMDEPIFLDMTADKLQTLKGLFKNARNLLWITRGCQSANPYANMTVGLGRSLSCELHEMRLQFLDSDQEGVVDANLVGSMLLRLRATDLWTAQDPMSGEMLWSTEPEWRVTKDQALLIPRMYEHEAQNNRYNSRRRQIRQDMALETAQVSISAAEPSGFRLAADARSSTPGLVSIRVSCSILSSVNVAGAGYFFVSLGVVQETGQIVIALSDSNASFIEVPKEHTVSVTVQPDRDQSLLQRVGWELLAQLAISATPSQKGILTRGVEPACFAILSRRAAEQGRRAYQVTDDPAAAGPDSVFVHPLAFESAVRTILPAGVSSFLDLSRDVAQDAIHRRVVATLPPFSQVLTLASVSSRIASGSSLTGNTAGQDLLKKACSYAQEADAVALDNTVTAVAVKHVPQLAAAEPAFQIVDWLADASVPVDVEPIERLVSFSPDKTYFLIVLTADLGQSLCEWFVRLGAKHIALTSRNPKIDPKWLKRLADMGANLKIYSMDITDKNSLQSVYENICETMPPIAGVANAAMVLQDIMFSNMEIHNMLPVLRPKVEGSKYLDELFSHQPLDFFILFSSLGLIVGNSGQSSYTAANGFMAALAAQRRARGLAASVMDIGAIIGAGYITRAGQIKPGDLHAYGAYPLSTSDFQQMFGEAVLASPPDSGCNPEIVTGLRMIDPVVDDRVSWRANPKFSHFWRSEQDYARADSGSKRSVAPVKVQLLAATSKDQARQIIQECFSNRLIVLLQLPAEDMDEHAPLVELGVDSLVAVEARSWFTKQLAVDIPVLRILGGASVVELVADGLEKLAPELIPNVQTSSDEEAKVDAQSDTNTPSEDDLAASVPSIVLDTPESASVTQETAASSEPEYDDCRVESESEEFEPVVMRSDSMSYAQARFWFLRHSVDDPTAFNITFSHSLTGDAHPAELAKAVEVAAQLHEGLRTCFFEQDNRPMQGILETSPLRLERRKITRAEEATTAYQQLDKHVYDLESGRTMRILLLEQSPRLSYLIVGYHHIAMDGAGFTGFLQELMRIGGGEKMPTPIQYPEYSRQLREDVETGKMKSEVAYWRRQFATIPPVLPLLPFAKAKVRAPLRTYSFSTTSIRIEPVLVARIKRRCRNFQATAFHFYLAVFKTMLFRFLDVDELAIGIADSNRADAELHRTMGILVNLLPLRFKSKLSTTFGEAVKEARKSAYGALEHSRLPFNVVLDNLQVERSSTHFPLFQVFMDYRPGIQERLTLGDVEVQRLDWSYGKNAYDINLDIMENAGGSSFITINAQEYLYGQAEVETMLKVYVNLLEAFSSNPALRLNEPGLFNESEVQAAAELGRGPYLASEWPATLSERVEDIARTRGSQLALKDGEGSRFTYQDMMAEVNKIATALLEAGVSDGDRVAVFQQPTAATICSLLAILRLGAVYVPLDLRSPMPRLAAILKDCQPKVILTHKATAKYATPLASETTKLINVTTLAALPDTASMVPNRAVPNATAVILYTSGSTGTPKGVLLPHSAIRNVIEVTTKQFSIGAETVLQQSALTFDLSLHQIFTALANGGTLCIISQPKRGDAVQITQTIQEESITYTLATPSEYSYWIRFGADHLTAAANWKYGFSLGEELKPSLKEEFRTLQKPGLRLINTYGPAEITVMSHAIEIPYGEEAADEIIPAGRSLPNYSLYVVDRAMKPLPVGMPGEICIGGAGVSQGYLGLDAMTQDRFSADAFAPQAWTSQGWTRMYRTGDKGRLRPDGALLFEGRMDGNTQIKLRGLRIELGEIEHAIWRASASALDEVIVSVRGDPEFLVAHVVFSRDCTIPNRDVYLQQLLDNLPLPQYMVPAMMIPLDRMPLTSHNKIDRKAISAIPLPKGESDATDSAKDLTPLETELLRIWEVVLSRDLMHSAPVGPNLDFFQVGGNSLLLIPLQYLIRETFNAVLAMIDFAEAHTVRKMAARIESTASEVLLDWAAETAVPPNLPLPALPSTEPLPPRRTGKDLRVIYTGATGHSGKYVLEKLVADDRISKIYLVAVRLNEEDGPGPRKLAIESDKIVQFPGNLLDERLGLTPEQFTFLATEADVILHSAANRSLWDNYQVLRRPNVLATQVLVSLAAPRQIPIHFMSSAAIHLFSGHTEDSYPETTATGTPPTDGTEGYLASKWAVEKLLENASHAFSIPVYFHRPAPVGPVQTISTTTVFAEFLRVVRTLRLHVTRESIKGHIDLIVLEDLARKLRDHLITSTMEEGVTVRYHHHHSDVRVQMGEWKAYMDEYNTGLTLDMVETEHAVEWVGRAKKVGFPYMLAAQNFDMAGVMSELPIVQRR
ncbi:putative hybrid PKS/NRPS enzyme EqiS-like protein [Aspergillus ibericus CBS 121593]|uniref:Putative hybrid PKS/NRPS enzyme EqiS-like protein n=1 Tax=Aspergillus ibericus CBS 121593 TaxID=1448316 RepID=A0A395GRC7_9EURO|nr:putative hybrid PKS/NRPS enzyme EqiS-like protein [Aspergillus ibericus CBS 121593]RAK98120.1 putative hybrid PKS/NRPS enzyme EqiS-like protein [Aspergillus ibericus CBS 121593]